jgi:CheY-like chemotaxis protein
MNLGVNARDAMPEGGKLIIETANVTLDEGYCKTHLGAMPGEYVLLSLSDNGHGMDKESLEHIFEPFYTTKETGRGTGLGLSMVFGIVKSHGGYITCNSEPEKGSTFKIYFPTIDAGRMEEDARGEEEGALAGGRETILLVEDEGFLLDLGKNMLERFGYRVLTADRGESAVEIYREKKDGISLVILDLIMPGMGGKKCLEELLGINPRAKVVIASGYSVNGPTEKDLAARARGFISKPYELSKMLKVVRQVLDRE